MGKMLTNYQASYTFKKIATKLKSFGYDVEWDSSVKKIDMGHSDVTKYITSYKIHSFDTTYGSIFNLKDNVPELEISLLSYFDEVARRDPEVGATYNLNAHIGTTSYDWEGEDFSLQGLVDAYLNDAYSDIANAYVEYDDYIEDITNEDKLVAKLNEGLTQSIDLDRLSKQVKESNEDDVESLEVLNAKVDTILDALGLVDEDAASEEDQSVDDVEVVDAEAETTKEEDAGSGDTEELDLSFLDEDK